MANRLLGSNSNNEEEESSVEEISDDVKLSAFFEILQSEQYQKANECVGRETFKR